MRRDIGVRFLILILRGAGARKFFLRLDSRARHFENPRARINFALFAFVQLELQLYYLFIFLSCLTSIYKLSIMIDPP